MDTETTQPPEATVRDPSEPDGGGRPDGHHRAPEQPPPPRPEQGVEGAQVLPENDDELCRTLAQLAYPIASVPPDDFELLMSAAGEAQVILLGESTHGTREFYQVRRELTQRLVREKGVTAVVLEADWPPTQRLDAYISPDEDKLYGDTCARDALRGFAHFPTWMWKNEEIEGMVEWLKTHNNTAGETQERVRLYGMDCYSLYESACRVVAFLDIVDPDAAALARHRYAFFEPFRYDSHAYGRAAGMGALRERAGEIQEGVARQVAEMQWRRDDYVMQFCLVGDADKALETVVDAEMNAEVVVMAEEYYRKLYAEEGGHVTTWNTRDQHMTATMLRILEHLRASSRTGAVPRVVVWAHNSHVADARATSMSRYDEWNLGQMMRQTLGPENVFVLAQSTYTGHVTAAAEWDLPHQCYTLVPGLPRSHEAVLHNTLQCMSGSPPALLLLFRNPKQPERATETCVALRDTRLNRAVGVVYKAHTELQSHYCEVSLPRWADALLFVDVSSALQALAA